MYYIIPRLQMTVVQNTIYNHGGKKKNSHSINCFYCHIFVITNFSVLQYVNNVYVYERISEIMINGLTFSSEFLNIYTILSLLYRIKRYNM